MGEQEQTQCVLRLHGVEKTYGTAQNPVPVLRGVDFAVREGEYVTIVGPSGSGKSTLLNIIGCLDRPTAGSYEFVGDDVSKFDDRSLSRVRNQHIGFVFQSFQLVSHLTVAENVELPLFYGRLPRRQRHTRCAEMIDRVGLGHRGTHLPSELSGGECQRAAIARGRDKEGVRSFIDQLYGNCAAAGLLRPEPSEGVGPYEEINQLLKQDHLEEAADFLTDVFEAKEEEDLINDAISLSGRISRLTRKERQGILTQEEARIERNKLRLSLQSLNQELLP